MSESFKLQPKKAELQKLVNNFHKEITSANRELEVGAFEAGASILKGCHTRDNLKSIVRWKSLRSLHYLLPNQNGIYQNTDEEISAALSLAANPQTSTSVALNALVLLNGIGIPVASAILTCIFPEKYTVIDFRALETLGHLPMVTQLYEQYLSFCQELAKEVALVRPQGAALPTTPLRELDHALWQWSANQGGQEEI